MGLHGVLFYSQCLTNSRSQSAHSQCREKDRSSETEAMKCTAVDGYQEQNIIGHYEHYCCQKDASFSHRSCCEQFHVGKKVVPVSKKVVPA